MSDIIMQCDAGHSFLGSANPICPWCLHAAAQNDIAAAIQARMQTVDNALKTERELAAAQEKAEKAERMEQLLSKQLDAARKEIYEVLLFANKDCTAQAEDSLKENK